MRVGVLAVEEWMAEVLAAWREPEGGVGGRRIVVFEGWVGRCRGVEEQLAFH